MSIDTKETPAVPESTEPDYTILVNAERTVLVTAWKGGPTTVALREDPSHTWGPPITVEQEA